MIKLLSTLIRTEVQSTLRQTFSWLTPLLFFIMASCLFPLALGSDPMILAKAAPAIIWVTALLAILISLGNIFRSDAEEGILELFLLSQQPLTLIVLGKMISHWLTHCLPLIMISPLMGFLLHLPTNQALALVITLLLGTPVLSMIGAIGAALMVGIQKSGLLLPILMMPLYIPTLIFGTGTLLEAANMHALGGYYALMGASLLLSLAFAPILTGIALRVGVSQ